MQTTIGRIGLAAALLAGAGVTFAETPHPMSSNATAWQCHAIDQGQQRTNWRIELDPSMPLAIVCDDDTPADYSPGHVRVRLAPDGPSLLIGLSSGRLVMLAPDGSNLAKGSCLIPVTI
jgi:hypothetical protein